MIFTVSVSIFNPHAITDTIMVIGGKLKTPQQATVYGTRITSTAYLCGFADIDSPDF